MKKIWEAIVDWIVRLFAPPIPEEYPEHEWCVCGHGKNLHRAGRYECNKAFPPGEIEGVNTWTYCACQIFIPDGREDDGDDEPDVPSPEELERLYSK